MINIGIITPVLFSDESPSLLNKDDEGFIYSFIQEHPDYTIAVIDILSIESSGYCNLLDMASGEVRKSKVDNYDVIHFLDLEIPMHEHQSLTSKWNLVFEKLDIIKTFAIPTINSVHAIKKMADKRYFDAFKKDPTLQQHLIPFEIVNFESLRKFKGENKIVKPANGESGKCVYNLKNITGTELSILSVQSDEFIVQPYIRKDKGKEYSILFINGLFTLAVEKSFNDENSFKQTKIKPYTPTAHEQEVGLAFYRKLEINLDIFRFDFVKLNGTIRLMEMESADPYHYADENSSDYLQTLSNLYELKASEKIVL